MTASEKTSTGETAGSRSDAAESVARPRMLQFPALFAISAYMCWLAAVLAYGVATRHVAPFYLVCSVSFVIGAFGLMLFRRWGWALTLAAIVLMSGFFFWSYAAQHAGASLVQGLLNLVFFLYLVRSEVRAKMR